MIAYIVTSFEMRSDRLLVVGIPIIILVTSGRNEKQTLCSCGNYMVIRLTLFIQ